MASIVAWDSHPQITYVPKSTWVIPSQSNLLKVPVKSNPFAEGLSHKGMATEDNGENIIRIVWMIHISHNPTDTSPFCLPVQTTGGHAFKLALYRISSGLEGVDARIVNTLHDEIIVEARDGIDEQVEAIVKESMESVFGGLNSK
jgi:hypothetical protein